MKRNTQRCSRPRRTWGHIDILVNNAGIATVSRAERQPLRRGSKRSDINVTAGYFCVVRSWPADDLSAGRADVSSNLFGLGEGANAVHKTVALLANERGGDQYDAAACRGMGPDGITVNRP